MSDRPSKPKVGCLLAVAMMFVLTLGGGAGYLALTSYETLVSRPDAPPPKFVIGNTTVVDVVSGTLREHVDVVIEGAHVRAIVPAEESRDGVVVDGTGKFVVPGLIDMHCHTLAGTAAPWASSLPIPERNLEQLLFAGVTRVFDPGAGVPDIFERRAAIANGDLLGPTIHAAGPMFTAVGGHPVPMLNATMPEVIAEPVIDAMARQVSSSEDATNAVAEVAEYDPDFIKLVVDVIPDDTPRLNPGIPEAIVTAAKSHDLRAVAHIGSTADAIVAAKAGVAAWIHGVYREEISQEAVPELVGFGIPMIPTMEVFKSYAELGRERRATALERQMVDAETLASYERVPDDYVRTPEMVAFASLIREQRANGLRNVGRLHSAGVRILAGSDQQSGMVPGASLHRELELLQRAGLPPVEVLRATTLYAARFLANTDEPGFGIVAEGKRADLVLVNANPLNDAKHLSDIHLVVLGGVVLQRHPLNAE